EQPVDLLDSRPLAARILRVPGFVDPFVVHVDEGVSNVEPLRNERGVEARLDGLEAQAPAEAAQERRLGRERAVDPVPLAEARQRARPPEPLQRDHVEALPIEPPHNLAAPLLTGAGGPL